MKLQKPQTPHEPTVSAAAGDPATPGARTPAKRNCAFLPPSSEPPTSSPALLAQVT